MTYAQFLLFFLLVPLGVLLLVLRHRLLDRRFLTPAGVLALVALVYMAPWDHTAAVWKLWMWAPGQTWGVRWWDVPPEEYLFCVLEALLGVTVTYAAMRWRGRVVQHSKERERAGQQPQEERPR
ncbi:MAG: lycopene cyclase domain-containing protein [Ktedonobacterales bacterium]